MIVLVTGGRSYRDATRVWQVLDALHRLQPITTVIEGGACGVDAHARRWTLARGVACVTVYAEWAKYGRKAGPQRNAQMLDLGPDLVLAFPGGRGTQDCLRQARSYGFNVQEVPNG